MSAWRAAVLLAVVVATGAACGKSASAPDVTPPPEDMAGAPAPEDTHAGAPEDAAPIDGAADAEEVEDELAPSAWELSTPLPIPAPTEVAGACIADLVEEYDPLVPIGVKGRVLELCRGSDERSEPTCWRLDLDQATLAKTRATKDAKARLRGESPEVVPAGIEIARDRRSVRSCVGPCVKLELGGVRVGQVGLAGERVFVASEILFDDTLGEKRAVQVFDARSGKRLFELSYETLESECPVFHWAGEMLYAELGVCAGPGAFGVFFDGTRGARVGTLGGQAQSDAAYGVVPIVLPSGEVAFREQYGHAIFFHDGKTGAHLRTLNISKALTADDEGRPLGEPEGGWMRLATTADGKPELIVGHGGFDRDRILLVDPTAASVTRVLKLEACP